MMITMGYHCSAFVSQIFLNSWKNDFLEMTLHHMVTVYLYGCCLLINQQEVGCLIAFCHDIADINISTAKFFGELIYWKVALYAHVANMFVWAYTRLMVFPWIIYLIITRCQPSSNLLHWQHAFFVYGLTLLAILHAYWLALGI